MKPIAGLLLALALCSCVSSPQKQDEKPPAVTLANSPSGHLPDMTDGKPMVPNNCQHDANVAYAILSKYQGANPRLIVMMYTVAGSKTGVLYYFGHEMCAFNWAGQTHLTDRRPPTGAPAPFALPPSVNPADPLAVARFCFPGTYQAAFVIPNPNLVTHDSPVVLRTVPPAP